MICCVLCIVVGKVVVRRRSSNLELLWDKEFWVGLFLVDVGVMYFTYWRVYFHLNVRLPAALKISENLQQSTKTVSNRAEMNISGTEDLSATLLLIR